MSEIEHYMQLVAQLRRQAEIDTAALNEYKANQITPEQRAVLDAAVAHREARIDHDETCQRVLFHGGHVGERIATQRALDDAANAEMDAVDALRAATETEAP